MRRDSSVLAVLAIIFACLGGLLGFVLSIIGLWVYEDNTYRNMCGIALGISLAWVLTVLLISLI